MDPVAEQSLRLFQRKRKELVVSAEIWISIYRSETHLGFVLTQLVPCHGYSRRQREEIISP
jgi:hypothetical protein